MACPVFVWVGEGPASLYVLLPQIDGVAEHIAAVKAFCYPVGFFCHPEIFLRIPEGACLVQLYSSQIGGFFQIRKVFGSRRT